jgi:hypothetical protein
MYPLQAEVGGDKEFVTRGDAEDGTVVPDAGGDSRLSSDAPADGGNQGSFG